MEGDSLAAIPLVRLLPTAVPTVLLIVVLRLWSLKAWDAVYANLRMVIQLLAIGYVLTYIFEARNPLIVIAVIVVMMAASSWIALRPLQDKSAPAFLIVLVAIGSSGLCVLLIVTQLTLEMPRWFEPRYVVPLAGMIFANAMNTVCLAAERFAAERERDLAAVEARRTALEAALIPQINALLAVGLVSLPGMMTGQILSGIDPLVAVRYQIMVMLMIFGSAGMAAVVYLALRRPPSGWE